MPGCEVEAPGRSRDRTAVLRGRGRRTPGPALAVENLMLNGPTSFGPEHTERMHLTACRAVPYCGRTRIVRRSRARPSGPQVIREALYSASSGGILPKAGR